jgi:hypothetical protein
MIGRNIKRALREQVEPHPAPVLSLYLDVNPANPANTQKAFVLRAREALRELDLDKAYIGRITTRLSQDFVIPEGRTLAIFAGEDPDAFFNHYYLQTDLPLLDLSDGALAHWGKPFVAPLLFALDQLERYAARYVSEDRARLFEVFLGQIEELQDFVRIVDTDEWRPYREARRSPLTAGGNVAARGGADTDRFEDRMEEATARLYRSLLPHFERTVREEEIDRIILIGLDEAVSTFEGLLKPEFAKMVVARLAPPANPSGGAHEWLPLVSDVIGKVESEHEMALLDRIRETGVWGVQETLTMLQEHRLSTLVIPWKVDLNVYASESGRIAATLAEAEVMSPGEEFRLVPLLEVLPRVVADSSTVLEFVENEVEVRLTEEFGGMAGVKRW